jgi:uncharacterized membrane protein
MRKFLTAVTITLVATSSHAWSLFGPKNFEECVLENMKGVTSDEAANQITWACSRKFSKNKPTVEDATPKTSSKSSMVDVKKIKQCYGTEPFWKLSIDGNQLIFDDYKVPMIIKNSKPKSAMGMSDEYIVLYQGKVVGQEKFLNVILQGDSQCNDNMSEEIYAVTAHVLTGSELYTGCCNE